MSMSPYRNVREYIDAVMGDRGFDQGNEPTPPRLKDWGQPPVTAKRDCRVLAELYKPNGPLGHRRKSER